MKDETETFAERLRVEMGAAACTCEPAPFGDGRVTSLVTLRGFRDNGSALLNGVTVSFFYRTSDGADPDTLTDEKIARLAEMIRSELSPEQAVARREEWEHYFGKASP